MVKVLLYKPEGRGSKPDEVSEVNAAARRPGVYSASTGNVYQRQNNVSAESSGPVAGLFLRCLYPVSISPMT
jgi:hypothetical protein